MIPKPVLPVLNSEDEKVIEEPSEETERPEIIGREKLVNSVARFLGFVASIGLPSDLMQIKIEEYTNIAMSTGVSEALITTVEYYFPDMEFSPALSLVITGIAFGSAVFADRARINKELEEKKKQEGKVKVEEVKKKEEELKTKSTEVS